MSPVSGSQNDSRIKTLAWVLTGFVLCMLPPDFSSLLAGRYQLNCSYEYPGGIYPVDVAPSFYILSYNQTVEIERNPQFDYYPPDSAFSSSKGE